MTDPLLTHALDKIAELRKEIKFHEMAKDMKHRDCDRFVKDLKAMAPSLADEIEALAVLHHIVGPL